MPPRRRCTSPSGETRGGRLRRSSLHCRPHAHSQRKDALHHRREPRHRQGHRPSRRAGRRERRHRREDHRAAPEAAGTIHTAAEEIEKAGGKALACVVDIRSEDQIEAAVSAAVAKFGGIDILVNNASAISLTGTVETPMKRYDPDAPDQHARHVRLLAGVHPAPPQGGEPAHLEPLAAAQHGGEVVRAARRVHDGEVRDEHVRARHGRRVSRRRDRRQRALAAHRHRDGGGAEPARRRRHDSREPDARDHGRRGARHPHAPEPRVHRQLLHRRRRLAIGRRDAISPSTRRSPGADLIPDFFV